MVMNQSLLETVNLTKVFKIGGIIGGTKLTAVDNVNLRIDSENPAILSIVGESGSGKTTLSRLILRLVEPTFGRVMFENRNIFDIKRKMEVMEFMQKVQPIFQNPYESFNPLKKIDSCLYNTALKLHVAENKEEASERVKDSLSSVGLDPELVLGKKPHELSGGELQRVSIARVLIPKPKLVIADEPVSMVDASIRMSIINLFLDLKKDLETYFIYITHDLSTAYYIGDLIAIMFRGNIVEYGPAHEVLSDPLHPYTETLIESIPDISRKWSEEIKMSGFELKEFEAAGCKFWYRCPYATTRCQSNGPKMIELKNGRSVMCFRYD